MSEAQVRNAFTEQAKWCLKLGSPFTALLCEVLGERLTHGTGTERRVLQWPGNPLPQADGLPLRLCGALHSLARAGTFPELSALYPPAELPDRELLWQAVRVALEQEPPEFDRYLAAAPQTNEVGRSAVLMCGFLALAAQTGLPLSLYEIGASAGLNLIPDRYRYRFGSSEWGHPHAQPLLAPECTGTGPPVATSLRIIGRRGCDIAPLDLASRQDRERLMSYVWPDQPERRVLLEAALESALADPPHVERREAAQWIEETWPGSDEAQPSARVLFHSIVWNYLPEDSQRRISAHVLRHARAATRERPLAWLRFELDPAVPPASLRLRVWPDGDDRLLAQAQPHGRSVTFLSPAAH
jgi:hypothetical protein